MFYSFLKPKFTHHFLLALLLTSGWLHAAPYGPDGMPVEFTQPDGTKLSLRVFGDEFYGRTETMDGYTVVYDPATKSYEYATLSPDGNEFASTGKQVSKVDPNAIGLGKRLEINPASRAAKARKNAEAHEAVVKQQERWDAVKAANKNYRAFKDEVKKQEKAGKKGFVIPLGTVFADSVIPPAPQMASGDVKTTEDPPIAPAPPSFTLTGDVVGLTILVDFSDVPGTVVTQTQVDDYFNKPGYTGFLQAGSVYDYFFIQSGGKLRYNNNVTYYVRVPQPKTYYNNTSVADNCGTCGRLLLNDALTVLLANGYDFSKLTTKTGGNIRACNVFFAGSDSGVWSSGLWPHRWVLSPSKNVGGGKYVYDYQITNIGTTANLAIGTVCHENGHMLLGYPDLYSYDGNAANMGNYSLMAGGNYGGGGKHPTNIDPYLKEASGWMDVVDLNSSSQQRCTVQVDGNQVYRYVNPAKLTEYFMFEVRDNTGWEGPYGGQTGSVNPGTGLVAYHTNETGTNTYSTIFTASNPNCDYTKPYELMVVEANQQTVKTPWYDDPTPDTSDAFRLSGKSSITDITTPDLKFWVAATTAAGGGRMTNSGANINTISADSNVMTFVAGAGALSATPGLVLSRSTINSYCNFGTNAASQNFTICNSQGGTLNYTISDNQTWLSCDVASGTATTESDVITINYATSDLAAGSYSAIITVTDPAALPTTKTITVTLTVTARPVITLSTATIAKTGITGVSGPQASFGINNTGGGSMTYTASETQPWLSLSPTSGTVVAETDTVYVNFDATALSPGTYNDTITVTSPEATNSPITIAVTFTVQGTDMIVTSPNGGELWNKGETKAITWVSGLGGNVKIELLKGGFLNSTLAANTANTGSFNWTIPGALVAAADYTVQITSIESPTKFDASNATFTILGTLADALDTSGLTWTTSGNLPWLPQGTTTHDGVDAGQSGAIGDSQTSSMETIVNGPGTVTFWWKVSSESGYDFLQFFLNGVEQASAVKISGEVAWVQKTITIPSGAQTIKWTYTKDVNTVAGSDAAWVDQVLWTPSASPDIAVEQPAGTNLTDGSATVNCGTSLLLASATPVMFTVKNVGASNLTGLTLSKSGAHSADFAYSALGATTVAPGGSTTFTVTFTPSVAGARTASLQIASNDSDENPFDITLNGTGITVGTLAVTPAGGLTSSGSYGGPFSPSSLQYTLSNPGNNSINWTAAKTSPWVSLSATSGTLAQGANTIVTVTINSNANTLNVGSYSDTVTFNNTTNSEGNTTRGVSLTVNPLAATVALSNLSHTYDGTAKSATVTTTPTGLAHTVTYAGSANLPIVAGTYAVVTTITEPNYSGSAGGTLTINKASQTITFGALSPALDNAAPFTLTGTASSGLQVTYASSNPSVATVSGDLVTIVGVGSTSITASQAGDQDHLAAVDVPQTLTVVRANPLAVTGGPYKVLIGQSLTLNGSGSQPSYLKSITAYDWDLNNDGTFGDVTGATPAAIAFNDLMTTWGMLQGFNTIKLRITDSSTPTPKASIVSTTVELVLSLSWDANALTAGQTNGAGAWLGANLWWDGAANTNWASGSNAVFGGLNTAGGAVTLASPTTVNAITFNQFTGTYTLGTTGQAITLNSGINKTSTSAAVTLLSPIILGGAQTWTNNSTGVLATPSGTNFIDNAGYSLTIDGTGVTTSGAINNAAVTLAGSGALVKNGTGRFNIGGLNSGFSGPVTINGGSLQAYNDPGCLGAGNLTINNGVFSFYWGTTYTRTLGPGTSQVQLLGGESGFGGAASNAPTVNLGGSVVWGTLGQGTATGYFNPSKFVLGDPDTTNAAAITFSSSINLNGVTRTIVVPKGLSAGVNVSTISGVISSTGVAGLIKEGNGTLVLSAANTYTGSTTISGGNLRIGGTLNSGNYAGNISIATGANLQIWSGTAQTLSGTISGAGGLQKAYGGALTLSGPNTYTGRTSFLPQTTAGSTVNITSFNSVNGGIPLMASSSLGAPTTIANGTIDIGNGATQANINLNYTGPGETTDRVINFGFNGTASQTLTASGGGLLKFTSAMTGNAIAAQSGKLILDGTGNGEITQTLPALPTGGLTKNGTGTWTLGGANSYTGPTAITAGKLFINGNQSSASGAVSVSANATLGGSGAIGGSTTIAVGGKLEFAISTNSASHNSLDVAALKDFTFSGASTLTITSSGGASPGLYTLVTGGNAITYTTLPTLVLPVGWVADPPTISGNSLQLNVTSIAGVQVALTYNANGATSGSVPAGSLHDSGTTVTVQGNTGGLAKTGYSFAGWNTAAGGTGTPYAPAAQFTINAATTLYAQWTSNTYTVTFNGNGGNTPTPLSKSVTYDSTYGTLATTTRTGYTFNGWFTATTGGSLVTSATAVAITGNQTLYAQWTVSTYTVTFDANGGGTPSPTSMSVTYGAAYGTLATITRAGYTFTGWFTATSGGTLVTAATTVAITANHTLYAQWAVNTYTVNFDANGGDTPSPTSKLVTYAAAYGPLASTARIGYSFNGWFTATSGGTQVTSATIVAITATQTLYAQWTADTYTVTFDANAGTAPSLTSISVTYGSTYGALATTNRSGHTFNGWFTAITGGTQVISTTPVAITADQTLFAQWTPLAPEIAVSRGASPITDGGYHAVSGTTAGTGTPLTFTIANSGANDLTFTSAAKSGESNCVVTIGTQPTSPVIPSGSSNLIVTVNPTAPGAWSFNLTLPNNNDADENPYNWTVHGVTGGATTKSFQQLLLPDTSYTGVADTYLDQVNQDINYDTATLLALHNKNQKRRYGLIKFDLPTAHIPAGSAVQSASIQFTENGGGISGSVDIYEATGDWIVNPVNYTDDSGKVGITLLASGSAINSANNPISIALNKALIQKWIDTPSSNYGLGIKTDGSSNNNNSVFLRSSNYTANTSHRPKLTVTYTAGVPEMRVARADVIVADAGTDTVSGTLPTVGTQFTYRIANLGNSNLTLPSLASASAVSNCSIVINTQPVSPVVASADTPLLVTVTPTVAGPWSATVSIASNDSDENPYNWTISGTTVSAKIVTFDKQGGTGGDNGVAATYLAPMPTATAPARSGYTFGGYYASAGGADTQYYDAAMASVTNWNINGDAAIFAHWIANSYTVSFDKQSGTGGSINVTATFGSAMPIADAPTRTGYTFDGFYTEINGGGTQYYTAAMASAANWGIASNTLLYAKWIADTYAITFNTQGGTGGSASASAAFESAMPTATAPTLTGYTFGGYYTAMNGGGTQYYTDTMASARNWDLLEPTILYAKWTASIYDVTFDKQGGTGGSASALVTYGASMPAATAPTRTGYTFAGYYADINGGGTQYYTNTMASATTWNQTTNTTLYAQWNALPEINAGSDQNITLTNVAWSPLELLPGLWLDASDTDTITLNGSTVSQWGDKSGNNRHATQGIATNQATNTPTGLNGKRVLTFDGSSDFFSVNLDFLAGVSHSAFIVTKPTAYSNIYGATTPNAGANSLHVGFNGTTYRMNYWANDYMPARTANFVAGSANIMNYIWTSGTSKQILANGKSEGTNPSAGVIGTMSGGGRISNVVGQGFFGGDIAEIIIIPVAITATDRQKLEGYLAHKWGLTGNLDAAHPYKIDAPVNTGVIATLDGTVSDAEGDALTTIWSKVSGPAATVTFANASVVDTTATFTAEGVYTLRLAASTIPGSNFDECIITVGPAKTTPTVNPWPTAAVIVQGQALSFATLTGGSATVIGSFNYDSPSVIPAVGTYSAAVTFTPSDTASYNTVSGTVNVTVLTVFNGWAGVEKTFDGDANGDGIADGMAWLLGAANPGQNATTLMPPGSVNSGKLEVGFKCLKPSKRGSATLKLQYSKDLGAADLWTNHEITVPETSGTDASGVVFTITTDPINPDLDDVHVSIPAIEAGTGGKIFMRMTGEMP